MASDNKASYSKLGITVVAGIAAIVATLIYLGGVSDDRDFLMVETYCEKSVSGLSVGSDVNFRGVKIGKVRKIAFVINAYPQVDGKEASLIRVVMALRKDLIGATDDSDDDDREELQAMIDHGLRATVTASGITGLSRIEFDLHPDAAPVPPLAWQPQHLYIPSQVSLLDSFSDSATKVMNQLNKMDLEAAWSNVAAAVEALAKATDGVRTMVETKQADLERTMEDAAEITSSLKATANALKRNPSLLIRERRAAVLEETE